MEGDSGSAGCGRVSVCNGGARKCMYVQSHQHTLRLANFFIIALFTVRLSTVYCFLSFAFLCFYSPIGSVPIYHLWINNSYKFITLFYFCNCLKEKDEEESKSKYLKRIEGYLEICMLESNWNCRCVCRFAKVTNFHN